MPDWKGKFMADTIMCAVALILYYSGVLKTPKRKKENGFELLGIGTVLLIILTGMGAAVYQIIGIPVNLVSTASTIFIADVVMWTRVWRQKQCGKNAWPVADGVSLLILIAVVAICAVVRYGFTLDLTYNNIDPARYMMYATNILASQTVSGEYMTDFVNAMFILFFSPFLPKISYYRAMVCADIFIHILSVCMFYILISKINQGRGKWCNGLLTIMYFGGYQLYSLGTGSYFHWVDGMLMVMFLIYSALLLEREEISNLHGIMYLTVGLFGLMGFYPILLVVVGPIFLPEVILWCAGNLKHMSKKHLGALLALLAGVVCVGVMIVGQRVGHSAAKILADLNGVEGPAHKTPYMDFLFFVPVLICFLGLLHRHKSENRMLARMVIVASAVITAWFIVFLNGYIISYYYYRMYYVLWLLAWLMTGQTICMMLKEKKAFELAAYAGFYGIVIFTSLTDLDIKLWNADNRLYSNENQRHTTLAPLYKYNLQVMTRNFEPIISEQEFELFNYVIENMEGEWVPMLTAEYTDIHSKWYRGIVWQWYDETAYDLQYRSLYQALMNLENDASQYFMILKMEPMYQNYQNEVFGNFEIVWENECGAIYRRPESGWASAVDDIELIADSDREMLKAIMNMGIKPYVVYDIEGGGQFAAYSYIYTGATISSWINTISAEDFIPCTYRLNNEEVEYLLVCKDSEVYQYNQEYFDRQEIVLETEECMLVHYVGTGWMPSQQE